MREDDYRILANLENAFQGRTLDISFCFFKEPRTYLYSYVFTQSVCLSTLATRALSLHYAEF
jgi:hypothetical protein